MYLAITHWSLFSFTIVAQSCTTLKWQQLVYNRFVHSSKSPNLFSSWNASWTGHLLACNWDWIHHLSAAWGLCRLVPPEARINTTLALTTASFTVCGAVHGLQLSSSTVSSFPRITVHSLQTSTVLIQATLASLIQCDTGLYDSSDHPMALSVALHSKAAPSIAGGNPPL